MPVMPKKSNATSARCNPEEPHRLLKPEFFNRPTCLVAEALIGKFLVRRIGKTIVRAMITETEAYDGPNDKACHAHRGKTPRNEPMFGAAGRWYVYFVYGMHWMLNIVTGPNKYPAAVLIRGVILEDGTILDGPAKLTAKLKIDRKINALRADRRSGLWMEDREIGIPKKQIRRTPRIGVAYAGVWAKKQWRFVWEIGKRGS